MKDYLKILQTILNDLHLTVESQAVSELHQSFEDRYKEDAEEFGEKSISDEEYLEKIIPSAQKSDKYQTVIISLAAKILKENGLQMVPQNAKEHLGSGAFGSVFSAIYKGQQVAAKITISYLANDFPIWGALQKRIEQMPKQYADYFPKIYLIKRGTIMPENELYDLIVMEQLKPLPAEVASEFSAAKVYRKDIWRKILTPLFITQIEIEIQKRIKEDVDISTIEQILKDFPKTNTLSLTQVVNIIEKHTSNPNYYNIKDIIYDLLSEELFKIAFPYSEEIFNKRPNNDVAENIQGLLDTLRFISGSYNIHWKDVHAENIMMSTKDNHLKIVDVGLFSFK